MIFQTLNIIAKAYFKKEFRSSHRRCFIKKVLLKISQNSQENTCARVSFLMNLQVLGLQRYEKRKSGTCVSLWILWYFEEHLFVEHLWATAFKICIKMELGRHICEYNIYDGAFFKETFSF